MINLICGIVWYLLAAILGRFAINDFCERAENKEKMSYAKYNTFVCFYYIYRFLYLPYSILGFIYNKMALGGKENDN